MKPLYFLIAMLFSQVTYANPYSFNITRVIDGDTVEFEAPFMPDPLPKKMVIRVLGVDTPEKGSRAKCPKENTMAKSATEFTTKLIINAKSVQVELKQHDKYGGRVLGDIIIDGKRLSNMLINKGLAKPYYGEKKASWCD
jgi:micrococcal nuclease